MPVSLPDAATEIAQPLQLCIDAHLHLWRYTPEKYAWVDDSMARLRRDFSPEDLAGPMQACGVQCGIAVQARQDVAETRDLLTAATVHPQIAGVVGWLPLADEGGLAAALDELCVHPRFVGVRHIVQAEPNGFLDSSAFNAGVARLGRFGLVYDLLIHSHQIEEATRFIDRHPSQQFVLNHLAKPHIKEQLQEPWGGLIRELSRRANVACKLSGMVTEADWHGWSEEQLRPYLDVVTEAFGPERLLAASDWPVCLLATSYGDWWRLLKRHFAGLSAKEQRLIFGANAAEIYRLDLTERL